jgi:hypothetical protein
LNFLKISEKSERIQFPMPNESFSHFPLSIASLRSSLAIEDSAHQGKAQQKQQNNFPLRNETHVRCIGWEVNRKEHFIWAFREIVFKKLNSIESNAKTDTTDTFFISQLERTQIIRSVFQNENGSSSFASVSLTYLYENYSIACCCLLRFKKSEKDETENIFEMHLKESVSLWHEQHDDHHSLLHHIINLDYEHEHEVLLRYIKEISFFEIIHKLAW